MGEPSASAELLAEIGRALHGDEFVYRLADDISVDQRTIRAWLSGKRVLHANNTAMMRAADVLDARARLCLKLADEARASTPVVKPQKLKAALPKAHSRLD